MRIFSLLDLYKPPEYFRLVLVTRINIHFVEDLDKNIQVTLAHQLMCYNRFSNELEEYYETLKRGFECYEEGSCKYSL
jgi:hypothetical protein